MVSGTFVLTDTINAGFHAIFAVAYCELGRGRDRQGRLRRRRRTRPRSRPRRSPRIERLPGVAAAAGGVGDEAQFVGDEREGRLARRRARARLQRQPERRPALQPAHARQRAPGPSGPDEVAIDANTADSAAPRGRRHASASSSRAGASSRYRITGHRRLRQLDLARRCDARDLRPRRPRRRSSTRRASSTRSTSPRSRACRARRCSPRSRSVLPPHTQVRTGQQQAQASVERLQLGAHVVPLLPARLRRHRALRRRVRDREHALDHDRPAGARVRDAARRWARPRGRCVGR